MHPSSITCRSIRRAAVHGLLFCWLVARAASLFGAVPLQLISVRDASRPGPATANGDSYAGALSADGRFVLFASTANNLLSNAPPIPLAIPPRLNVYLRDRATTSLALVSVNLSGTGGGNGDSIPVAISTNGRYALFESSASDLVNNDTNNANDIFVRDLLNNTTILVSANLAGGVANAPSRGSVMTPDGRYVAFVSEADNLVSNDLNRIADVFLRDVQNGTTTLISAGAKATNSTALSVSSEAPDITPDGRYVAFFSTATNLVAGVGTSGEIYVRDVLGGATIWASTNAHSLMQSNQATSAAISFNHAISTNGNFIAFESSKPPSSISTPGLILRFNLATGQTDLVSTNANVAMMVPYPDIHSLSMTPDGRFIVFVGNTNLSSTTTAILLWDAQSGSSVLVSGTLSNTVPTGSFSEWPLIDPTGEFVAFLSTAPGLVTNSVTGGRHFYVRDTLSGITTLVDANSNAVASSLGPTTIPKMSDDARHFAFESLSAELAMADGNHDYDVFVRDLSTNTLELISARDPALASTSAAGPSTGSLYALSANGRIIAFSSEADDLVASDTNGMRDIFLRDLDAATTVLGSVSTNGGFPDGPSAEPAISADGRWVAFTSTADNLVPGDNNRVSDVFVRDLQTGTNLLVSIDPSGTVPGNKASYAPLMTPNGRYVVFRSKATNLGAGPFSGTENFFLRDLQLSLTYALTTNGGFAPGISSNGRFLVYLGNGNNLYFWDLEAFTNTAYAGLIGGGDRTAVSPDGQRILYLGGLTLRVLDRNSNSNWVIATPVYAPSRSGLRFTADGRLLVYEAAPASYISQQIFLYDFELKTNLLITQSFDGLSAGNGDSDSPDITPDGRLVIFRSSATNLLAMADTNRVPDLFLYDRATALITLLTPNYHNNNPGDNRSLLPALSGDGRTLLFQSWASDLIPSDFNQGSDIFLLRFLYATLTLGSFGQGPTLSWPIRPGETYHVQFKNNLADATWQDVAGSITITGDQAQLTDTAPSSSRRFYRIAVF